MTQSDLIRLVLKRERAQRQRAMLEGIRDLLNRKGVRS
jgi:hypothetical protein